jgi:hypothetical protein
VYPDASARPGLTWWAGRPPLALYAPGENYPEDRIDFIWFAGPATASSSDIVGEPDGPEVSVSVKPWPSDHRAVVSEFSVLPAAMPELATTGRRIYTSGDDIDVAYYGAHDTQLAFASIGKDGERRTVTEETVSGDGRLNLHSDRFPAGHYELRMSRPGDSAVPSKDFWVLDRDATPAVEVIGDSFIVGEPIEVRWENAPGNRNDYLAIYPPAMSADYDNGLAWAYTNARPDGRLALDANTTEWAWPVEPGTYVVRLLKDDGYELLAESSSFTIR